jgi:G8 domain
MSTQFWKITAVAFAVSLSAPAAFSAPRKPHDHAGHHHGPPVHFSIRSVASGNWSNPKTWKPARVPGKGDRVLVSRGSAVRYDVESKAVLRMVQVAGALRFSRSRNTELNVGLVKVQNSDVCSESGFACDFVTTNKAGEPHAAPKGKLPLLEIGTQQEPIPSKYTARIRLHYLPGMNKDDAPAIACCSARMEIHGAPLNRTWVKLGADVKPNDVSVTLATVVTGWRVGDEVIVTASKHTEGSATRRNRHLQTEQRKIVKIDGRRLTLNAPLRNVHFGTGKYRSEVANLSRNVVIESADPDGVRGHTVYHRFSKGGISYARFAHLGKQGLLGRYAVHFHLVGDTMRGASVIGAAIVDSHNRWVTIHGTQYLVVRDCVGYRSIGHGFFLEDGTEEFNLLDHNLGVNAFHGRRLPKQVLPFDPNDGAAFWWANGRNTLTRNVAVENEKYGYRYDIQKRSNFDSRLPVMMPDGTEQVVDVRTIPISRFSNNESHSEGLYSAAFAGTDGAGPDTRHPHRLSNLTFWQTHYALRTQVPTMLVENVDIDHAAYGIYRPWFENHVYRHLRIAHTGTEPFNRGLDDESTQHGKITVDGLTFEDIGYGGQMPLIQISDNNPSGKAESHFRNVKVLGKRRPNRWPLVNLGGGPRPTPKTPTGVPYYLHDYFGPGRTAKVVSTRAKDLMNDGHKYERRPPLTGDESAVAEVKGIEFPKLLDPVDDLPPATVILSVQRKNGRLIVRGVTHDDGTVKSVSVNGKPATIMSSEPGVADWRIELPATGVQKLTAAATDAAGNVERRPHVLGVR